MLFDDFKYLIDKYNLKPTGAIHIGAHYFNEYSIYKQNNISKIICFEPLPHIFEVLKNKTYNDYNIMLCNMALGNDTKKVEMHVEYNNNSMSSSILEPLIHLKEYPNIKFQNKIVVNMDKLDNIKFNRSEYNFINIDVQGYELDVFYGAKETLKHIQYIIAEINKVELYKNGAIYTDVDDFLSEYKFTRVHTDWTDHQWGDALYIKG